MIPGTASLIVESSDMLSFMEEMKGKPWVSSTSLPPVAGLNGPLALLDSFVAGEERQQIFGRKKMVASLHVLPGQNTGWILYLPMRSQSEEKQLGLLSDRMAGKGFSASQNTQGEITIHSIMSSDKQQEFSCFIYKNIFVAAASLPLLHEVVKTIDGHKDGFFKRKEEVREKDFLEGKVRVYLKYDHLAQLLGLVSGHPLLPDIGRFARESILELTLNDKQLFLNGYSFSSSGSDYLGIFKKQKPQAFQLRNYIPMNTSWLFYLGFDAPEEFGERMHKYFQDHASGLHARVDTLRGKYGWDPTEVYAAMGKEAGLCVVPGSREGQADKFLFIQAPDPQKLLKHFEVLAGKLDHGKGHTARTKDGRPVLRLGYPELPSVLFGSMFQGFPQSFITTVDDYIVIATSADPVKNLLTDIENENVWGKTLEMSHLLEESISEFNLGLFVNFNAGLSASRDSTGNYLVRNAAGMNRFDFLALQYTDVGETMLTNLLLTHHLSRAVKEEVPASEVVLDAPANNMFLLSGKGTDNALLILDSLHQLYYIAPDHTVKWKYALPVPAVGEIFQADLDRDKKQDIVLATESALYAFSKEGKMLKNFPVRFNDTVKIAHFSVINYSGRSEPRLAVAAQNGNLYLCNPQGTSLEGWSPKIFRLPLADRLRHARIGEKDVLIAAEEDGTIHLMNRRGETFGNFPQQVGQKIVSPLRIRKGRNLASSYVDLMTEEGNLISLSFTGKASSLNLGQQVRVVPRPGENTFVVEKPQGGAVTVVDHTGKEISLEQHGKLAGYYHYPARGNIYLLHDSKANAYRVADKNGKILTEGRLNNGAQMALAFYERRKKFRLYTTDGNRVGFTEF